MGDVLMESTKHNWLSKTARIYNVVMTVIYAIALLACFIVDVAINRSLTWFFVVLSGVMLAYCITNVPVLVKRRRIITSAFCTSIMVYVVLYACNWFVGGDWLYTFAFPVATLSLAFGWVIILALLSRIHWMFKLATVLIVAGIANITVNPWIDYLLHESWNISGYIGFNLWTLEQVGRIITFICCIGFAIFLYKRGLDKRRSVKEMKPLPAAETAGYQAKCAQQSCGVLDPERINENTVIDLTGETNGNNPGHVQ
jgi:hypothetical protein